MVEFYRCSVCGNMVALIKKGGGTLVCCGKEMVKLEANSTDASQEKHVPVVAKEGGPKGVSANVVCPGFVRTPLVEKQIPEQAAELHISEDEVIKNVMLKDTVDGEFTTTADIAETVAFLAGFDTTAINGQSIIVSHGWFMQ